MRTAKTRGFDLRQLVVSQIREPRRMVFQPMPVESAAHLTREGGAFWLGSGLAKKLSLLGCRAMNDIQNHDSDHRKTRVLLVDDHQVVRFGITQLINQQHDLVVCGEAADAAAAMDAIATLDPDLVMVDLSLDGSDGLELIKNIDAQYPRLPVLVLSTHDEALYAELALHAGAEGYVMKHEAIEKILAAVRKVSAGVIAVSEATATRLLVKQTRGQSEAPASPIERLSDRELQVFQLIGQWKGTRSIAAELHLSVKTVEYYREQIKRKLNLKNAAELMQLARYRMERALVA